MKVTGVLWRFTGAYVLLLVAATVLGSLLRLPSTGLAILALVIAVSWVCSAYAKANGRYFTSPEKTTAIGGMLAIDLAILVLVGLFAVSLKALGLSFSTLLTIAAALASFHAILIYAVVSWEGRRAARRAGRSQDALPL